MNRIIALAALFVASCCDVSNSEPDTSTGEDATSTVTATSSAGICAMSGTTHIVKSGECCGSAEPCVDHATAQQFASDCLLLGASFALPTICLADGPMPDGCAEMLAAPTIVCNDGLAVRAVCCSKSNF